MEIWSGVSRLFWREERAHAVDPEPLPALQASGAPAFLRQAVRFTMTGFAATLLTAQIVGIRLAAPVDASGSYGNCEEACGKQYATDVQACTQPRGRYVPPSGGGSRNPDPDHRICIERAQQRRDECKARCSCN